MTAARNSTRPYAPPRGEPSGRARKTIFELPPLELECMKVVWEQGEASVRQIRGHLPPPPPARPAGGRPGAGPPPPPPGLASHISPGVPKPRDASRPQASGASPPRHPPPLTRKNPPRVSPPVP